MHDSWFIRKACIGIVKPKTDRVYCIYVSVCAQQKWLLDCMEFSLDSSIILTNQSEHLFESQFGFSFEINVSKLPNTISPVPGIGSHVYTNGLWFIEFSISFFLYFIVALERKTNKKQTLKKN